MQPISELSSKYGVNSSKPYFPVNSLRLLYFIISDFYSAGNQELLEKVGQLVPKVEAVFTARTEHRGTATQATPKSDYDAALPALEEIYALVGSPSVHQTFDYLFSTLYPLQDDLFLSLYQNITSEKPLAVQDMLLLLKVRSMDSIIFANVLANLIGKFLSGSYEGKGTNLDEIKLALQWQLNLAYQLNDLVDTVVYAKEDLEANSFSPFQVIRKIAPEANAAKELIKNTLNDLRQKTSVFPFPPELQEQVNTFYTELIGVVHN
jgi:hypothetical protein